MPDQIQWQDFDILPGSTISRSGTGKMKGRLRLKAINPIVVPHEIQLFFSTEPLARLWAWNPAMPPFYPDSTENL